MSKLDGSRKNWKLILETGTLDGYGRVGNGIRHATGSWRSRVSTGGKVYVETTIFSFFHDRRTSPAVAARRMWTREWWNSHRSGYEVVTSTAVLDELEEGSLAHKSDALNMARTLPAISVSDSVRNIVDVYIRRHVMPAEPLGDALHLALASVEKCDFLLTWNCQHLANANKFPHIRTVNALLGLHVPLLVTPLELGGDDK